MTKIPIREKETVNFEEKMCPDWCGHEDICSNEKHNKEIDIPTHKKPFNQERPWNLHPKKYE